MHVPNVRRGEASGLVHLDLDDVAAKSLLALFRFADDHQAEAGDLWFDGRRMSEVQWRRLLALGGKLSAVLYPPTPC